MATLGNAKVSNIACIAALAVAACSSRKTLHINHKEAIKVFLPGDSLAQPTHPDTAVGQKSWSTQNGILVNRNND